MRSHKARTHYDSGQIKVNFLKIILGDVLYSWPTAWGMIMHYPNPPCVNVPCVQKFRKPDMQLYRCQQQLIKLWLWVWLTSKLMHVLIVRDVINHFVCIGNTAERKNTEDNKTGSLDPRKKWKLFWFQLHDSSFSLESNLMKKLKCQS